MAFQILYKVIRLLIINKKILDKIKHADNKYNFFNNL